MKTKQDFIAVIMGPGASGSWARDADKDNAVRRVAKIFRSDFKSFGVTRKTPLTVNVVDVTGHDEVWWNESGFHVGDTKLDRPVEVIKVVAA
jgi:hypothetical protein